jgi:3-oxoacyl-[acyl-carrier protein] reductase
MTARKPLSNNRRVALVTGASRGIGRAIAIELARAGFDVMINYSSNEVAAVQTRAAAQAASGVTEARIRTCRADVSKASHRQKLLKQTHDYFGRLDLLVNNAGIAPQYRVDLLDAVEASFDRLISVNLKGPYFLAQAAARWMLEQKARKFDDYNPAIVNIGSISAYAASPERGDYCVSKAGLAMATQLFALRLAEEGIGVYEVRPGIIATDMTANVKKKYDRSIANGLTPIKRWGLPEDVAKAVAAIANGSLPFSTGEVINVDGGFHLRRL